MICFFEDLMPFTMGLIKDMSKVLLRIGWRHSSVHVSLFRWTSSLSTLSNPPIASMRLVEYKYVSRITLWGHFLSHFIVPNLHLKWNRWPNVNFPSGGSSTNFSLTKLASILNFLLINFDAFADKRDANRENSFKNTYELWSC